MTATLIAIDPGEVSGVAFFSNGLLASAALTDVALGLLTAAMFWKADVVIELPQIYRASRSKGDPNGLITLAVMVGRYVERAKAQGAAEVTLVKPAEWKGQTPKKVHNQRVLAKLSAEELRVLSTSGIKAKLEHNVIDAIGLGLWRLGRMPR
jgi:hypothetical protein